MSSYHLADPQRFISNAAESLGFAALFGASWTWTVGGVNVWGILATVTIGGGNLAWLIYRYFDEKREKRRLEDRSRADQEFVARLREENAGLRAKLGFVSGEIPAVNLTELREDYHSKITKALTPED